MSDLPPPPGWYANPETAGEIRYWDGRAWTDHVAGGYAPNTGFVAAGRLPDTGSWFNKTFGQLSDERVTVGVYVLVSCVIALTGYLLAGWAVSDVVWDDGDWQGLHGSRFLILGVATIVGGLAVLSLNLALVHRIHNTGAGLSGSIGRSFGVAVAMLPRVIGWLLVAWFVLLAGFVGFAFVTVAIGPLALLLILAFVPLMVFVMVRLAFVLNGFVAPPVATNFLRASTDVSAQGRFWPVTGRLALLWLFTSGLGWVGNIMSSMLGGGLGADTDANVVRDASGAAVFIDVGEIVDNAVFDLGLPMLVTIVVQVATMLIFVSGTTAIYVSVHGDTAPSSV
jgi:hypothetical protein